MCLSMPLPSFSTSFWLPDVLCCTQNKQRLDMPLEFCASVCGCMCMALCSQVYDRKPYDARAADIWSLGVMLFMLLVGYPPYATPQQNNRAFEYIIRGHLEFVLKHWRLMPMVPREALGMCMCMSCCLFVCESMQRVSVRRGVGVRVSLSNT